jgi:hypothetical protein
MPQTPFCRALPLPDFSDFDCFAKPGGHRRGHPIEQFKMAFDS